MQHAIVDRPAGMDSTALALPGVVALEGQQFSGCVAWMCASCQQKLPVRPKTACCHVASEQVKIADCWW